MLGGSRLIWEPNLTVYVQSSNTELGDKWGSYYFNGDEEDPLSIRRLTKAHNLIPRIPGVHCSK